MKLRLNKTVAAVASSALLLMAVPAVGIATSAGASSKPTYVIGYEGPLSGGNQQLGLNMIFAVQLAVNKANASKKLPYVLKLVQYDDQGSGTLSPAQAQAAVANKKLIAVVGPAFSGATKAAEPYYSAAHIATVSPSATAAALATGFTHNNFMRVVAGDDVQGTADANFLVTTKSLKSLYVVNDGSFYGSGLATVVASAATKLGATVTPNSFPGTAQCQDGTASASQYTAEATQVVASKAAGLFYGGYYCDFGLLLGALSSAGYTGAIMSGDGSWSTALVAGTSPASAANNVFLSEAGGGNSNLTGKLASEYKALAHFSANNATYAAQSYDATNIILASLAKIWSKHSTVSKLRPGLINELHKITLKGVTGKISFQSNGDLSAKSIVDFGQIQSGTITSIGHT